METLSLELYLLDQLTLLPLFSYSWDSDRNRVYSRGTWRKKAT